MTGMKIQSFVHVKRFDFDEQLKAPKNYFRRKKETELKKMRKIQMHDDTLLTYTQTQNLIHIEISELNAFIIESDHFFISF